MLDLPVEFKGLKDGGIGEMLGREILSVDRDQRTVEMAFELGDVFMNFQRVIHGGIVATLLDTLCGVAIRMSYDSEQYAGHVTLELKTSFLAAAYPGRFTGTGRVLRLGKSVAFAESELFNADAEKIASASATFKLRKRKPSS